MRTSVVVDAGLNQVNFTVRGDLQAAQRIAASIARSELVTLEVDTTGVGMPLFQSLEDLGVPVKKFVR